jgi:branched-chain amino acid transport system ATP-binding protein
MRPPALALQGLRMHFGRTEVLRGVDLAVAEGERLALIGPNGAGKSTLFQIASGGLAPTAGEVRLFGAPITGLSPQAIHRRGLARSFQGASLFGRLSVYDNLRCSVLWSLGYRYNFLRQLRNLRDANRRTEELIALLGLERWADTPAMALTYAAQRALELGITIASGARMLLLDEPTAGMDRADTAQAIQLIRQATHGRTLLLVEHDMGVVFDLADRVAVLVRGEVLIVDTPAVVRADPRVQEAYLGHAAFMEPAR